MEDLPFREAHGGGAGGPEGGGGLLRGSIEELEKKLIVEAMEKAGDHQTRAAELLGISERMLRYKLKKYGSEVAIENRKRFIKARCRFAPLKIGRTDSFRPINHESCTL